MRRFGVVFVLVVVLILVAVASAGEFKAYPGAKLDEKASKDAAVASRSPGVTPSVYTTSDSFAAVASFYKGIAKEYAMPRASGTSGNPKKREGYDLYEAYFIFDGAQDLMSSGLWVKVQRPAIGLYAEDLASNKIRDITVITVSKK
jgi:hypothetical protein